MASNRLELIQGVTNSFVIDLTSRNGDPVPADTLTDASVNFKLRVTPTGSDVLAFQTPDPTHLVLDPLTSTLTLTLTVADSGFALGPYVYQIEMTLSTGEVDVVVPWAPADMTLGGSATPAPPPFDNTIKINQDYPLAGDLRYMTPGGSPIIGAQVRVYAKSDYDAGNLASPIGITTTDAGGGWVTSVLVVPGYSYVVQFFKPYEFGPDVKEIIGV